MSKQEEQEGDRSIIILLSKGKRNPAHFARSLCHGKKDTMRWAEGMGQSERVIKAKDRKIIRSKGKKIML